MSGCPLLISKLAGGSGGGVGAGRFALDPPHAASSITAMNNKLVQRAPRAFMLPQALAALTRGPSRRIMSGRARLATPRALELSVPIEKAFAIHAQPHEIYAAIERDLGAAGEHEGDVFEVMRRDPSRSIELRVTIGGIPCWLSYTLRPAADHTEVSARLVPFGWKYTFFRIMTFGMRDQGYEVALVEALSNLKAEVEGLGEDEGEAMRDADSSTT